MTARSIRRAMERKITKAARKAERAAAAASAQTTLSESKLAANRANAQLSTGPTSAQGKAIVSRNATKHGLTGAFKVLPGESQSDFDQVLASLMRGQAPVDEDEVAMVQQMAEALWLSRRSLRLQNECFGALASGTPEEQCQAHKQIALFMRYQTTSDRTFTRYANELRKRRAERARTERGFVSQTLREAAERRREEGFAARQSLQLLRQQAQEIRNRAAAAKAEALEYRNSEKRQQPALAAAAA